MVGAWARFAGLSRESGALWACTVALDSVTRAGAARLWPPRTVPAPLLGEQIGGVLRAWSMPPDHLETTVERMLYADLRGIDTHGCANLPFYDRLRREGRLEVSAATEVVRDGETTALLDGGGGLGHVPATIAMEKAIERGAARGVGAVAVRNSGHCGALGAYAAMASGRGLIGLAATSTSDPALVPTFGREPMLGTNPIAIAAPAGRNPPFLLDMATSAVSHGALVRRSGAGRRIPRGWALDGRGRPTRNGRAAARDRRLAPLGGDREHGGHKGYGLALAVEILTAVLGGAADRTRGAAGVGHLLLALDPARFRDADAFAADLNGLIDSLRATPPADPGRPVLVPGDPEQRVLAERRDGGIPLSRGVFEAIRHVAIAAGARFVLDEATS